MWKPAPEASLRAKDQSSFYDQIKVIPETVRQEALLLASFTTAVTVMTTSHEWAGRHFHHGLAQFFTLSCC